MQECTCSTGFTQYPMHPNQYSSNSHTGFQHYQYSAPYSLDNFQPGCGLRRNRKYTADTSCNKNNNMSCNQFNSINFHRKCTCYLKLNFSCQCQCGMLPSMFHKLVCAPYTTLSKVKVQQQSLKKTKKKKCSKCSKCSTCSRCNCCTCLKPRQQKLDILSDQQNIAPKYNVRDLPQPTEFSSQPKPIYHAPERVTYQTPQPQTVVSFKSVPINSIRNIIPVHQNVQPQIKNTMKQMPVISEIINKPPPQLQPRVLITYQPTTPPTSNPGIFVLEQSKKSIKVPQVPVNNSQTSIYRQAPQQRVPMIVQPQQQQQVSLKLNSPMPGMPGMNPNFLKFMMAQHAMLNNQRQSQLIRQQQHQQTVQNNQQVQEEQQIQEEEYQQVQEEEEEEEKGKGKK